MSLSDSYSGRRFRGALLGFAVGRVLQALATLGLILVSVRVLGRTDYGAYMVLWGIIDLADLLTVAGLQSVVYQYLPRLVNSGTRRQRLRFVTAIVSVRAASGAASALMLGWAWKTISAWFSLPIELAISIPVLLTILLTVQLGRLMADILEAMLEQRDAQALRALHPLVRLVGMIALAIAGAASLATLLKLDLFVSVLTAGIGVRWLWRRLRALPAGPGVTIPAREIVGFGWRMAGAQLLVASGNQAAVRLLVGRVLGVEAAGAYAFLAQVVFVVQRYLPSILLANMIRPMLVSRVARGQFDEVGVGLGLLLKVNLCIVLGLTVATVIGGDAVLTLASAGVAAGQGFALSLLMLAILANAQVSVIDMALEVCGFAERVLLSCLLAPTVLLFAVIGGSEFGLVGIAAGVAATAWLRCLLGASLLRRATTRVKLRAFGMYRIVVASAALSAGGYVRATWTGDWVETIVAVSAFAALVITLRPLSHAELAMIDLTFGQRVGRLLRRGMNERR